MKKVLITLMTVGLLGSMSSCNKWLDVEADTQIPESVLMSDGDGMRIAMNGIYQQLGDPSLYGKEYTFGLISFLGGDYINSPRLKSEYNYLIYGDEFYEDYVERYFPGIWTVSYNALANVNNLLQNVQSKDESFFQWGKLEKDIFLGELHGLRALIHFDLLRLYAPAPIKDDGKLYIPYVEKYPEYNPLKVSVDTAIAKIERDLLVAHNLLMPHDTATANTAEVLGPYTIYTAGYGFGSSNPSSNLMQGSWFGARRTRMNFYAATALLMRLYMWDQKPAKAEELGHYFLYKKWFTPAQTSGWTAKSYLSGTRDNMYRKMWEDILMAASSPNVRETYESFIGTSTTKYMLMSRPYFASLYKDDSEDWRQALIEDDNRSSRWVYPNSTTGNTNTVKYQMPLCPIIRTSEVVLMLCEIYADTDLTKAITLLQQFRQRRGINTALDKGMNKDAFMALLEREWAKEFNTDGQRWFYFKRRNESVYRGDGNDRMDYDAIDCWVFPLPFAERTVL